MMDKNVYELILWERQYNYCLVVLALQFISAVGVSPFVREFNGHTEEDRGCEEHVLETDDKLFISSEATVSYMCMHKM